VAAAKAAARGAAAVQLSRAGHGPKAKHLLNPGSSKGDVRVGLGMGENALPLVSVMIATWNRIALLLHALGSVFKQDYPCIEVLIVDDASSDGTSDYVRAYYPQVRMFRFEENRGYVAARNLMMREAGGEYIVSLDDDAYLLNEDAISNVVHRMQQELEIGVVTFRIQESEWRKAVERPGGRYTHLFVGCGHCIRKAVIERIGYYREFFFHQGEENDLSLRILDNGYRILSFPGAVVVHTKSPIAREVSRAATYRIRNLLLCHWINEPFPWWVLLTGRTIVGCMSRGWKERNLPCVIRGLCKAIRDIPRAVSLRNPVSSRTLWLWHALRGQVVSDSEAIRRLYKDPPRSLMSLWR
jgi:GT2 family glycosyltransferase